MLLVFCSFYIYSCQILKNFINRVQYRALFSGSSESTMCLAAKRKKPKFKIFFHHKQHKLRVSELFNKDLPKKMKINWSVIPFKKNLKVFSFPDLQQITNEKLRATFFAKYEASNFRDSTDVPNLLVCKSIN